MLIQKDTKLRSPYKAVIVMEKASPVCRGEALIEEDNNYLFFFDTDGS